MEEILSCLPASTLGHQTSATVDSGASTHLTGELSHIEKFCGKFRRLRVADRILPGFARDVLLKKNSHGLTYGAFHPDLEGFLLSTGQWSEREGGTFRQSPSGASLSKGTKSFPVRKDGGVLNVNLKFFDSSKKVDMDAYFAGAPEVQNELNNSKVCSFSSNITASSSEEGFQGPLNLEESDEDLMCFSANSSYLTNLRRHERFCHFHIPGLRVPFCSACATMKSVGSGHASQRPEDLKPTSFNEQVDTDYIGPFPTSIEGSTVCLVMVDAWGKWVEVFPCKSRDQCGELLERWCGMHGVPTRVRTDNAKEFKEPNSPWRIMCLKKNIIAIYSAPYHPQMNGLVERTNRTLQGGCRSVMCGVDSKVWDRAMVFVAMVWVRLPRKGETDSIYKRIRNRDPSLRLIRRFGCLCFEKVHVRDAGKLVERALPCMYLGMSRDNSTYVVGRWHEDGRTHTGIRWVVNENRDVSNFVEDYLISDLNDLKPDRLNDLFDRVRRKFGGISENSDSMGTGFPQEVVTGHIDPSTGRAPLPFAGPAPCFRNAQSSAVDQTGADKISLVKRSSAADDASQPPAKRQKTEESKHDSVGNQLSVGLPEGPGIVVVKRGRGRPKGSKSKPDAKRTGPKPKDPISAFKAVEDAFFSSLQDDMDDFDPKDEIPVAFTVQVTRKQAFEGPDRVKFLEADALERFQLETLGCWRPLKASEIRTTDEIIPSVVIYTKKRCGRFKARLVALGNRQKNVMTGEVYSPVVSHVANRFLLVDAAAKGHYITSFDISNAFIKAILNVTEGSPDEDRVFVRLPAHWSKNPKGDLVRLLKSLYGLRISPRKWYDTYATWLKSQGWVMHPTEPGLWRKGELTLSMYVDDTLLSGPCERTVIRAREEILKQFPGKIIDPVMENGWETWDIFGVKLSYNRALRSMKMNMQAAIDKLLEKFRMVGCRPVASPCVSGDLSAGEPDTTFPIRSLVGALLHVANMCRPDIAFAVQRVARHMAPSCTSSAVKAAKRILQYLSGTKTLGIAYSPGAEAIFRVEYEAVLQADPEAKRAQLGDCVTFSDSDFAGCTQTFYSTSGSILYYKGTPVAWKASRQSIRAYSTCEAEYVALYDSIRLTESAGFKDWFDTSNLSPHVFGDNQSSLTLGKMSLPTKRSKHFMLRFHLVREYAKDLAYVPTGINRANPLTKGVPRAEYLSIFGVSSTEPEPRSFCEEDDDIGAVAFNVDVRTIGSDVMKILNRSLRSKHLPVGALINE